MTLYEDLVYRGLVQDMTSPEVPEMLETPQTVYCGFDPSASSLQCGNLCAILMLKRLQNAGHKVIALVGGATGLIGDPSGKSVERNMLTVEQVEVNKAGIRENLSRYLDFSGPNAAIMVDNYDFYKGMSAIGFLRDVAVNFRVPQMLAKESVKKRLEASEGALTFTEFAYQILQGNDFLELHKRYGCTMEVGGADQWGNITAGTDLVRKMLGREVYGLTIPLVCDSSGRKFGKSEGNAMFLDASKTSVYDFYQFFLRSADADVIRYLKIFTFLSPEEISAFEEDLKLHPEQRNAQKRLAEEVTRMTHGEAGLQTALAATKVLFGGSVQGLSAESLESIFKDVKSTVLPREEVVGRPLVDIAAAAGMFGSKGEARRMAQQGGLSINAEKADAARIVADGDLVDGRLAVLRSGKKNYFLLKVR